ncbi:MAG: glycosyltransferase [Pegethrix bostrychoides GSE-TBD4-15B]|jgi:glycosyltransferase involved in cell wall biosynthesis|uniref:Glycosyltransferase n=1 Tax=Pegethrix bostrychoides GSE-TBD4-15B TaxID=2839662 RepID=A0A951P7M2_9CYAN|nr:glycosyltransferase [Pegethrix bostrychoides GSE-TBD4-15B]
MTLSVVILCHNEFGIIGRIVQAVRSGPIEDVEIIVVDDCSTDGIRDLLQSLNDRVDQIFYHPQNRGRGAALRTGFAAATGKIN